MMDIYIYTWYDIYIYTWYDIYIYTYIYTWYDIYIWYINMIWYDIWYMIYDIWYMIYDIWYMIYDIWYMIYDIWYMIYDIWYMIYDIWYMIYDMICIDIYMHMCGLFPLPSVQLTVGARRPQKWIQHGLWLNHRPRWARWFHPFWYTSNGRSPTTNGVTNYPIMVYGLITIFLE